MTADILLLSRMQWYVDGYKRLDTIIYKIVMTGACSLKTEKPLGALGGCTFKRTV